jgi:hypothetical protein
MSNFAFLAAEFPAVHEAAVEAARQTSCAKKLISLVIST